jgi:hypothetical protein
LEEGWLLLLPLRRPGEVRNCVSLCLGIKVWLWGCDVLRHPPAEEPLLLLLLLLLLLPRLVG